MAMQWLTLDDARFTCAGLHWWPETRPKLLRLPERYRARLPRAADGGEKLWFLAQQPSGGRLIFRTDSRKLSTRFWWPGKQHVYNLSRWAYAGQDVWVDGEYWQAKGPLDEAEYAIAWWDGVPEQWREVCIYLPHYCVYRIDALGIEDCAELEPTRVTWPRPPIVIYGTSITQGACASRASLTWPAVLARQLGMDFVNLSMSGAALCEPIMAEIMAEIDASLYIVDVGYNHVTSELFAETFPPFLDRLLELRPETPILCVSPTFGTLELFSGSTRLDEIRDIMWREVLTRIDEVRNLYFTSGLGLLGSDDRSGLCDHTHPNDVGHVLIGERLTPIVRAILGPPGDVV